MNQRFLERAREMPDAIIFNNRVLWAGKTYVEFCLHMLIQEIEKLDDPPSWLLTARDIWDEQAHSYVGELTPMFDYILTTEDRAKLVVELLRRAVHGAMSRGTIPVDELNRMNLGGNITGKFTNDVVVANYAPYGEGLIRLLRPGGASQAEGEPPLEAATDSAESAKGRRDFLASCGGDADAAMRKWAGEWRKLRGNKGT